MRHWIAGLACALVAAVAAIGWMSRSPTADRAVNPSTPSAGNQATPVLTLRARPTTTATATDRGGNRATQAQTNGTPYEEYKARKECLDIGAAPESISRDVADLESAVATAAPDARAPLENEIRRKQAQLDVLAHCGSAPVTRSEVGELLARAAREGDHAAQLEYALDPMIDRDRSIENLDRLRDWRGTALDYVRSAVDRGDPRAMVALAGAYDPLQCQPANRPSCSDMLPLIVAPDAATAYRYYVQSTLTGNAPSWVQAEQATLEQFLSPDQIAEARKDAKRALDQRSAQPATP